MSAIVMSPIDMVSSKLHKLAKLYESVEVAKYVQ